MSDPNLFRPLDANPIPKGNNLPTVGPAPVGPNLYRPLGVDSPKSSNLRRPAPTVDYTGAGPEQQTPAAPVLTATAGIAAVLLTWNAVKWASYYRIYRGTTSGGEVFVAYVTVATYLDTGLTNGTAYYYQVSAVGLAGEGQRSAEVIATTVSPLLTNLIAYYAFETLTADSTGNGNTLTNNGGVTQAAGLIGQAASFVGASSQNLSITANAARVLQASDFTVAGWVKPTANGLYGLFGVDDAGGAWQILIRPDNNSCLFLGYSSTGGRKTATKNATIDPNNWYFVAAQYDCTSLTLSVDVNNSGTPATATLGGAMEGDNGAWVLSNNFLGFDYLTGLMDEWGVWKSAAGSGGKLTAAQLTSLYNGGSGRTYPFAGA